MRRALALSALLLALSATGARAQDTPAPPASAALAAPATPAAAAPAVSVDAEAPETAPPVVIDSPVAAPPVSPPQAGQYAYVPTEAVEDPRGVQVAVPAEVPDVPLGPPPFGGRAYPARYAQRPLTLGEGVLRIDSGSSAHFGGSGIVPAVGLGLRVGVTPDLEVGVSWTVMRDPAIAATYRFALDPNVDLGVRVSVRLPVLTTGNTVVRVGVPLVVRGGDWFRLSTGIDLDLLFESNVSPLVEVPVQLLFSTSDRISFGVEGWVGILDGREVHGRVGAFFNPVAHTPVRALWDTRLALAYLIGENAIEVSTAVSFYPQLW